MVRRPFSAIDIRGIILTELRPCMIQSGFILLFQFFIQVMNLFCNIFVLCLFT